MAYVLFVEDDPSQLYSGGRILSSEGHSVRLACDGLEALSLLEEQGAQIICTDFDMPNMDGFELATAVRTEERYRRYSKIPIIGVGCFPLNRRTPLTQYLGKPFMVEELLSCVTKHCKQLGA